MTKVAATKRTGTVDAFTRADGTVYYRARIRLANGTRPRLDVPEGLDLEAAQAWAAKIQADEDVEHRILARLYPDAVRVDVSTAEDWFKAWIAARKRAGLTSTKDNDAHYRHHIRDAVHGKHVRDWSADDLRSLVASLDAKIATHAISHKYASNVWGTASKMCADATRSKVRELRVRDTNPAKDVEGPDDGDTREKQYLYPNEFLQLVTCEGVPLRWRRAIALAVYLFPRAGELRALRWEDVDLVHGTLHIHRAFERRERVEKATKTGKGRRFAIDPSVRPLLEAMHEESGGEGLVMPLPNRLASRLREWLTEAGLKRHELTDEKSRTTKPLTFHDLRATGLTWMAVRGDEPLKIMQRAGHEDFQTTQIYVRTAEAVRDGFGEPFPRLPASLLGPALSTPWAK